MCSSNKLVLSFRKGWVCACVCVFFPPGLGAQNSLLSIETVRLVVVPRELGAVCFFLLFSNSLSLSLSTICESFGCPCCSAPFCCFFFFADFDQILFLVGIYAFVDTKLQSISCSRADLFHRKKCYGHRGKSPLQGGCSIFCVIFSQFLCLWGLLLVRSQNLVCIGQETVQSASL